MWLIVHAGSPSAKVYDCLRWKTCKRLCLSGLDFVSRILRAFGNPVLPRPVLVNPR
jgi:hypothetical protein